MPGRIARTLLLFLALVASAGADDAPWVLVDTARGTVSVMRGDQRVLRLADVSFGRGGVSRYRVRGDERTPLGEFRVMGVRESDRYHRFIGISYPSLEHAEWGREQGLIDEGTYWRIFDAFLEGREPPQHTALGGALGFHGIGAGDPAVHRGFHWTRGCIALTNDQIESLQRWIAVGTRVVVR